MESTLVSGVEIRNDSVAPLPAPFLLKARAVGKVEQEHKGRGIPKREARNIDLKPFLPKCRKTKAGEMKAFKIPATAKPNRMKREACLKIDQVSRMNVTRNSTIGPQVPHESAPSDRFVEPSETSYVNNIGKMTLSLPTNASIYSHHPMVSSFSPLMFCLTARNE